MTYDLKRAWLYSLDATDERLTLSGHSAGVPGIAFSPDGSQLASVGKDRMLRIWDSATGRLEWERELEGQGQRVAYSADGRWLLTTDYDRERVCFWSTKTGKRLFKLGSERKVETWSAEFTDDQRYLVTGTAHPESGAGALTIWSCTIDDSNETQTRIDAKPLRSFPGDITGFAFAPDNRHFAFVDNNAYQKRELYQWDLTSAGEPRLVADDLCGISQAVNFTPDGQQMLVVDTNHVVVAYHVQSGQKKVFFPTLDADYTGQPNRNIKHKPCPSGVELAVTSPSLHGVDLFDCKNGRLLYSLPEQEGSIYYFAWSPDGRRLAVSRSNGAIDIWNLAEIERVLSGLGLAP